MVIVSPGWNAVTAPVAVPPDSLPHGPVFCGLPSESCDIQDAGVVSTKWACAMAGASATTATAMARANQRRRSTQPSTEDIVGALGEERYRQGLDAFEARFRDETGFKKFLETITRQDARELIYGTILE